MISRKKFLAFKEKYQGARGLDVSVKDPKDYVTSVKAEIAGDGSLGIGSLKGL